MREFEDQNAFRVWTFEHFMTAVVSAKCHGMIREDGLRFFFVTHQLIGVACFLADENDVGGHRVPGEIVGGAGLAG